MAKKAKSVKEQTLEQKLWGAAEKLRGNLDAAEYKSVVLGLVFLKYINDSFKAKYEELTSDPYGRPRGCRRIYQVTTSFRSQRKQMEIDC